MKEKTTTTPKLALPADAKPKLCGNRCSQFDEDCVKVDPIACFMGLPTSTHCCNTPVEFGIADGFCPYIHNAN